LIINIRGKLDFQPRITFFCSIINRPTVTYLLLCSPYFSWLSSHWIWACCWWCDGKRWWCLWSYHEGDDLTLLATSLIFSTCYLWFFFLKELVCCVFASIKMMNQENLRTLLTQYERLLCVRRIPDSDMIDRWMIVNQYII
jgi:hypothetical protein